jgi:hypothetical protein
MLAMPYVVLVVLTLAPRADIATVVRDPAFVLDVAGALVVALVAATAAFATAVPGYVGWRRGILIGIPTAWFVWMAGSAFVAGLRVGFVVEGWQCLPAVLVFGALPAIVMGLLLRRGAPLTPALTLVLGALAAASLADAGTRICHGADGADHLLWHLAAVGLLVAIGAGAGKSVLRWPLAAR